LHRLRLKNPESLSPEELRRLRRTVQMVFQGPYTSLNPARTVGATLPPRTVSALDVSVQAQILNLRR
jgi:ABC-type dipeptide/oligopeptide/nickel transport system ATPase subunit